MGIVVGYSMVLYTVSLAACYVVNPSICVFDRATPL